MNHEPHVTGSTGGVTGGKHRELLGRGVQRVSAVQEQAEDAEFLRGLTALRRFSSEHHHTRVPDGQLAADGFPLAAWVAGQRLAHLENRLPAARRASLERVPGWQWEAAANG
ncbi:helicase associated protein [Frankia sp. EI5c]|uniref:helicase associated domain-containing protein n=1 Tax=Frankia sp. EI5c TaxID=683316 RepID=UPI0007C36F22|nr:helicase associated domain-containing protein [Frankia sp. EI5c]OAA27699.1 helicase associated protein [Frankia sp. EI5c]